MSQSSAPPPNPSLFWEAVNGYQRSAAIRAAIDHDLFTAVAEGADTAAAAAQRRAIPERGVRILLDYLTAVGFLTKSEDRYALTADTAAFLDSRSPSYLGGMVDFLQSEPQRDSFLELTETVRRGTIPDNRDDALGVEHPMWVSFARSMAVMMAPMAKLIAGLAAEEAGPRLRTLDIAAGHGLFGIAVARALPQARITAVDWLGVLSIAEENARQAGVADRHQSLPGNAFEVDLGDDYDLALVTNFFHHFDRPGCLRLMRKLHAALRPGGRLITLEFIPNEDRVTPPDAAMFSLTMLAGTPSGDAYTFADYDSMCKEAGFAESRLIEPPFGPQRILIARRPD